MVELARASPGAARLVLFAYASELVPHPLDGLRTYEDLALRFEHLGARDETRSTLERALVEGAELVEFGIRRAGARLVQSGLRFRTTVLRAAVPLALRSHSLRVEFRRVLATLGERTGCPECQEEVFAVPLYRLRGLDDLHAMACPRCGHLLRSYFLPRGKDVQSVLNTAFLDLELLSEWRFRMGSASVAVQLLPVQLERMTVGQLRRRFWVDVLERHAIPVPLGIGAAGPGATTGAGAPQARTPRDAGVRGDVRSQVRRLGDRCPGDGSTSHPDPVPARCRRGRELSKDARRPGAARERPLVREAEQDAAHQRPGSRRSALRCPRRFFASSRRSFAPRDGRVGRRGRRTRVRPWSTARSRSSAVLRFWAWLRRSVAVTVTPVGG